ncbi:transposase [Burkholderia cenocepacia]|nr:transposase [Burkholderia cenocepacia]
MREPARLLVCRGHETITELTSYDRCNSDQEEQGSEGTEGVSRRTDDQLLAQVQGKNAESILGESGLGRPAQEAVDRAHARGRDEPPSGSRDQARQGRQPPQWHPHQDVPHAPTAN